MSIAAVIGWKFNHQPGMKCREIDSVLKIIQFPGGVPSQTDQDIWSQEYSDWVAAGGLLDEKADIEARFDDTLKAFSLAILDEINILRTTAGLQSRTVAQLKNAIKARL